MVCMHESAAHRLDLEFNIQPTLPICTHRWRPETVRHQESHEYGQQSREMNMSRGRGVAPAVVEPTQQVTAADTAADASAGAAVDAFAALAS